MKKYTSIGDLIKDYRELNGLAQDDIAAMLNVDLRTVKRWENNESWLKNDREMLFAKKSGIPLQVIRNLNCETPIPVWYDVKRRAYTLSEASFKLHNAAWYQSPKTFNSEKCHVISSDKDIQFISDIQKFNNYPYQLKPELIKTAAKALPELNVILEDNSGLYNGHIVVLPLKYETYFKIRKGEMAENEIDIKDLDLKKQSTPLVLYYYSIYADSPDNTHYIMAHLLNYFKQKRFKDYIFAGISNSIQEIKIKLLREMGLKTIWEEPITKNSSEKMLLLEGNFDMFLFGKGH